MNREPGHRAPQQKRLLRVSAPPRRLRDIRTLSTLRTLPRPVVLRRPARAASTAAQAPIEEVQNELRTWLFLRGGRSAPALIRHPVLLSVDRQLQPEVTLKEGGVGLLLLAELPGVHPAELRVLIDGDVLSIESGPPLRYFREVLLPYPARFLRQELRDGLLEVELVPARTSSPPLPSEPCVVAPVVVPEPPPPPSPRGSARSAARALRPTSSAPKRRGS